jgi:adenosylmethionine-8-amino-7-oxononanoate aminotransferase
MHAWQREGVVPDLQTVGKGLGGGFPISGMLLSHKVAKVFANGTGEFSHGHTHQGNPLGCAIGLEILKITHEDKLLDNINNMGDLLAQKLHERLDHHANVGNIRGRGLFWGVSSSCHFVPA